MSRNRPADTGLGAVPGARRARSCRIGGFIGLHLATARAAAQCGRPAEAAGLLLELRSWLVGRLPGASSSRPHDRGPSALRPSPAGRRDWLAAVHLTAQAIAELNAICAGSGAAAASAARPADLDAWERRHRERIGRWARHAPSVQPGLPAVPPEGSP